MKRESMMWALLTCVLTLAAALVTFALPQSMVRPSVVFLFLSICPGMVITPFFPKMELLVKWTFTVALSFTVDILLVTLFMYAGWWSPTAIIGILLTFCGCGGIAHIAILFLSRHTSSAHHMIKS